jgi:DNA-directed RNA polymerase sigma subunit (sigma70/sigma32)
MTCKLFNEYRRSKTAPQRKLELEALLMAKHRGLVCSIAKSLGCSTPDARQEGMIALLTGIRHFLPARGTQPSTYLYWPIYNALKSWRAKQAPEVAGGVPLEIIEPFATMILLTMLSGC